MSSINYSVVTKVTLNTQQIKFLIDLLWGSPEKLVNDIARRHNVNDAEVENELQFCLGSALSELL